MSWIGLRLRRMSPIEWALHAIGLFFFLTVVLLAGLMLVTHWFLVSYQFSGGIVLGLLNLGMAESILVSWYEQCRSVRTSTRREPGTRSNWHRDGVSRMWQEALPFICGALLALPLVSIGLVASDPHSDPTLRIAANIGLVSAVANGIVFLLNAAFASIVSSRG